MSALTEIMSAACSVEEIKSHHTMKGLPNGVSMKFCESRGKGLFAERSFAEGEQIFKERCIVGLQVGLSKLNAINSRF